MWGGSGRRQSPNPRLVPQPADSHLRRLSLSGDTPHHIIRWNVVLYYYKTYPTFDVLGTQFDMVRSKANENLHKLSPLLYDTLVHLELMPYREFDTPEALKAALQGIDQVIIDATERTYRRSQDDAKQREHYSGKKTPYVEKHRHVAP
jgi:hypothetical protein